MPRPTYTKNGRHDNARLSKPTSPSPSANRLRFRAEEVTPASCSRTSRVVIVAVVARPSTARERSSSAWRTGVGGTDSSSPHLGHIVFTVRLLVFSGNFTRFLQLGHVVSSMATPRSDRAARG